MRKKTASIQLLYLGISLVYVKLLTELGEVFCFNVPARVYVATLEYAHSFFQGNETVH